MFTAALLTVAKIWKQLKCPSADEWGRCDPHTHVHTHIHTYTHTHMHAYTHTLIHTYMDTHIHTYTHTYTHAYIHTRVHLLVLDIVPWVCESLTLGEGG